MRTRLLILTVALTLAGCGGAGPAALGYGLPAQGDVIYEYVDTTLVDVSMMGQKMEIAMLGAAEYRVAFGSVAEGVRVTLTVEKLAASVGVPIAGTERADEGDVRGALVFALDAMGNATVTSTPDVSVVASRMISGLSTAHTFFPGLPGRAVSVGDRWIDTVSYEGDAESGAMKEVSVLEYTLVGDTVIAGRDLLEIAISGTTELSLSTSMGGMDVTQNSTLEVEGHVLWDARRGLMFEMLKTGRGEGTAAIPLSPRPLPIEVRFTQRTRLRES